jgi:hypothetical protein
VSSRLAPHSASAGPADVVITAGTSAQNVGANPGQRPVTSGSRATRRKGTPVSRQLKRVPLSFSWPLKQVWGGYLNPYAKLSAECPYCENGYDRVGGRPSANAALFIDQWYGNAPFDPAVYGAAPISPDDPVIWDRARRNVAHAPDFYRTPSEQRQRLKFRQAVMDGLPGDDRPLVPFPAFDREAAVAREARRLYAECFCGHWCHHLIQADVDALVTAGRLWDFTRRPRDAGQALVVAVRQAFHDTNSWLPESNGHHPTATEINAWSRGGGFGHDAINAGICIRARCARENVPFECVYCQGSGAIWPTPEIERQHEDWEPTDPPTGDGYQLWEDCSKGSPISPVFASLDELCAWATVNATTFDDHRATAEEWREMLDGGVVHARMGNNTFL